MKPFDKYEFAKVHKRIMSGSKESRIRNRLQEELLTYEEKQLSECTFKPNILKTDNDETKWKFNKFIRKQEEKNMYLKNKLHQSRSK